jgi:hypothetical protein
MYTDPSGESIVLTVIVGAIVGAALNVAANANNIQTAGQFFAYAGIGALAGAAGGAASCATAGFASVTGFLGGMAAGVAGGATGGFITGAGNSWMQGGSFGQGVFSGFRAGVMGGVTGGFSGGIMGGLNAWSNGASFLDGSFTFYTEGPGWSTIPYKQALIDAEIQNNSILAEIDDKILIPRYYDEFGFQVGDMGFDIVTTKAPLNGKNPLGYDGKYYVRSDGRLIAGTTRGIFGKPDTYAIHISPGITLGDDVSFRATAGHELIHAIHISTFGLNYSNYYSENTAYRYSYETYFNARMYDEAMRRFTLPWHPAKYGLYRFSGYTF